MPSPPMLVIRPAKPVVVDRAATRGCRSSSRGPGASPMKRAELDRVPREHDADRRPRASAGSSTTAQRLRAAPAPARAGARPRMGSLTVATAGDTKRGLGRSPDKTGESANSRLTRRLRAREVDSPARRGSSSARSALRLILVLDALGHGDCTPSAWASWMIAVMIARLSPESSRLVDERPVDLDRCRPAAGTSGATARSSRRRSRRSPAARRAPCSALQDPRGPPRGSSMIVRLAAEVDAVQARRP